MGARLSRGHCDTTAFWLYPVCWSLLFCPGPIYSRARAPCKNGRHADADEFRALDTDHAILMLVMWAVMMAAMMLPSAAPMILLHATIARGRHARGERATASSIFVSGYIAVWTAFSLGAVALVRAGEGRYALADDGDDEHYAGRSGADPLPASINGRRSSKPACCAAARPWNSCDALAQWGGGAFGMGGFSMARTASVAAGC